MTFLEQVWIALKPGGRYLILGPNLRYLNGAYWDFFDHHLGLTHLSLSEALRMQGFEIDTCIDRFLPFTTQGALPTHPLLVRAYLLAPCAWRFPGCFTSTAVFWKMKSSKPSIRPPRWTACKRWRSG